MSFFILEKWRRSIYAFLYTSASFKLRSLIIRSSCWLKVSLSLCKRPSRSLISSHEANNGSSEEWLYDAGGSATHSAFAAPARFLLKLKSGSAFKIPVLLFPEYNILLYIRLFRGDVRCLLPYWCPHWNGVIVLYHKKLIPMDLSILMHNIKQGIGSNYYWY